MRVAAAAALLALLGCGCAGRGLLPEAESRAAAAFFAAAAAGVPFPHATSFSGTVESGHGAFPFVAGIRARSGGDETVGLFDPLGRAVLTLAVDGADIRIEAGPLAGPLAPLEGKTLPAEGLSVGRILGGAPGFLPAGGDLVRVGDGGWQLSDGRQTLRTDPRRRFISEAVYRIAGRPVSVSYPGREAPSPPARILLELPGASIELRRDEE